MKRGIVIGISAVMLAVLFAVAAFAQTDIEQFRECGQCGMDRKAYGYSRMLVEHKDGRQAGTCSLHCMVAELDSSKGEKIVSLKVADRDSRTLIDAEKAVWVLGGKKRGVMTMRAKWAFASREAAQKFVDSHGGVLAEWKEALAAAVEDAKPQQHP